MLEDVSFHKSPLFIKYLEDFWRQGSPYLKYEEIVEKKPLSLHYIYLNANGIRLHLKPYKIFERLRLEDLTLGMIDDWKVWILEKGA